VELDNLQQWSVGDRMLTDLLAGRSRDEALALEWRRGLLPPGQLGWRKAQQVVDEAAPVADMVESFTAGLRVRAVDHAVDHGVGRRLVGPITDVYDTRVVRSGYSRLGPRHELEAWVAVLALEAAMPGRGWTSGAVGRGRRGDPPVRVAFASPERAAERLAELVALYDAGMSGPLPLPLRTGSAWARRRLGRGRDWDCRVKADDAWNPFNSRFPGENAEPAHRFVWGEQAPIDVLLGPPHPGEEYDGESTRLGALAMRLWAPLIEAAVRR
jgi:exodeoxyribonuclease V gamma subunit